MDFEKKLPKVVIVGKINSGKSTLFNRLINSQKVVTSKIPGTTRDWVMEICWFSKKPAYLIDTAGFLEKEETELEEKIKKIWRNITKKADLYILVVDSKIGPTLYDKNILNYLRKFSKPIILVINKVDSLKLEDEKIRQFSSLSADETICISALLNKNISKLKKEVAKYLNKPSFRVSPPKMKIAFIGRPNVGKSTLLNALIEKERALVDEKSGTTRDELEALFSEDILLIDTPGLKRKSKIKNILDFFSSRRTLYSIKNSDIIILIIDAKEGPVHQEIKLASVCKKYNKKIIVVINKIDLIEEEKLKEIEGLTRKKLYFLGNFPIIPISALLKKNLDHLKTYLMETLKSF